jgi:hypothetical protein
VSSHDKSRIISQLLELIGGKDDNYESLCQRAELIADEMLENALYSAPRDSGGRLLFTKGSDRAVLPEEKISLRGAFDGEQLFLEVSDSWGNLLPKTVEEFLTMNVRESDPEGDRGGRGLYIMWKFLDYFYINVNPGAQTTMGGVLKLHHETV